MHTQDSLYEFPKSTSDFGPAHRPRSIEELDVSRSLLEDLTLKALYLSGSFTITALATKLHLSFEIVNDLVDRLRAERLCQVIGMVGNIPQITLTSQGRTRASELLAQNQYSGATPVSLECYSEQTRRQSMRNVRVHSADLHSAFEHLVMDSEILRQLGTALNSGSPLFLYGPSGTGKTTMAEVLSRVASRELIWIPYALQIDGHIVTIYDPSLHERADKEEPDNHDARWVLCRRPAVLVGGELTAEMLDMQFNAMSKFYVGPVQLKANNGVLIIDDFGRQRLRPEELLNRWIVPLDRRIDFLTLAGGKKIEVPFEMMVVFASNTDPDELVDPSFIRRIKTKIRIGAVTSDQFREIFRRVAAQSNVPFDPSVPDELMDFIQHTLKSELRSCYPIDIVSQVCWAALYEEKAPYLDHASLRRAIDAYFTQRPRAIL